MNKNTNDFEWLWEHNKGALFLKEENSSLEWKKSLANYFYYNGFDHGNINMLSDYDKLENINIRLNKQLKVAIKALEFECGNRCANQNPCNARETLNKIKEIENGPSN